MFCFHKWKLSATKFTPRLEGAYEAKGKEGIDAIRKVYHGFTIVIMRCARCGTVKVTEHTGDISQEITLSEYGRQLK